MEAIKKILDRPIAFHRCFITITGSVNAALMLSQAVYWSNRTSDPGGWFHKTAEEWEEEIGLSRHEQDNARAKLRKTGFWQEARRGAPATMHFRVDGGALHKKLIEVVEVSLPESGKLDRRKPSIQIAGKRQSRLPESGKPDSGEPANKMAENRQTYIGTETTAEITAEITAEREEAPALSAIDELATVLCSLYQIPDNAGWRLKDKFQVLAMELHGLGATPADVRDFYASRHKKPGVEFFAGDFVTWRASQNGTPAGGSRAAQRQEASAKAREILFGGNKR